jgi:phage-related protein
VLLKDTGVESKLDSIDKKASGVGKSMGSSFSSIAGAALKLGAVLGLGMGIKEMIDTASKGQDRLAQMNAVLTSTKGAAGMTAEQLTKLADANSKLSTMSKGTNMDTQNLLLTFTQIGKDTFPQATVAVNDMATSLKEDASSAAMQLGKALNDPVAGVTALQRVGVKLTEQQKEQVKAMVAVGDVAGAQKLILAELATEFGGSALAASKTFSGQMTIAKNSLIGIGGSIGDVVLPYLTQFTTSANDNMPKIQKAVTTATGIIINALKLVKDNFGFIKVALETLGVIWLIHESYVLANTVALLAHNVVLAKNILLNGTDEVTTGLATVARLAHGAATKIATAANWLFSASAWAVLAPVLAITAGLVLLGIGIYEIVKHWDVIKAKTIEVWHSINTTISTTLDAIKTVFTTAWNGIKITTENVWNGIKTFLSDVWNGIVNTVVGIVTGFVTLITNTFRTQLIDIDVIFQGIRIIFENVWDIIKNIFLGAVLLILDLVTGNFTKLKEDAGNIFSNLQYLLKNIWDNIINIIHYALEIITTTFTQAWEGIKTVSETVWNGIKTFLENLWTSIQTFVKTALTDMKTSVINASTDTKTGIITIFNSVLDFFRNLPSTLYNLGATAFTSLKSGISSILNTLGSTVSGGFSGAISFITGLPSRAYGWGRDFIQGLINGIRNMIGGISSAVTSVGDKIRSLLHFSTPDEGPLADYEGWMPDFMGGLAKGISASKYLVTNAIKGLSGDMSIGVKGTGQASSAGSQEGLVGGTIAQTQSQSSEAPQPIQINLIMDGRVISQQLFILQQGRARGMGALA